jgi:hypothetical protein
MNDVHPSNVYYRGYRDSRSTAQVRKGTPEGEAWLNPRLDLDNRSPTGLEWGYGGSGPYQLSLALLADALGPSPAGEKLALAFAQDFKWAVIARLDQEAPWRLTYPEVLETLSAMIVHEVSLAAHHVQRACDALQRAKWDAGLVPLEAQAEADPERSVDYDGLDRSCWSAALAELRAVLAEKLGMSAAFADRLLGQQAAL